MLLVVDDQHRKHLEYLVTLDKDVISEFCRISLEFIMKGVNSRIYQYAAEKLGADALLVQQGVEGLMYLLSESVKMMIKASDFQATLITLGFSEPAQLEILQNYNDNFKELRSVLTSMSMELPHYKNLEWRCDVKLASKSLHHQIDPVTLLKLVISKDGKDEVQYLECDIPNLVHMTDVLDQALQEAKTQRLQRIKRQIK